MQNKTREQVQGERSDFSKNQKLYGEAKNKDVQNPKEKRNPIEQSEEEDIDTTKPTWHHGDEVDEDSTIDPLGDENTDEDFDDDFDDDFEDFEDEDED